MTGCIRFCRVWRALKMKRIMIDRALCDGCLGCTVACMANHSKTGASIDDLDLENPENVSRNAIRLDENGQYAPIFCRHCDEPECALTCITGAMVKDEETGLVLYDAEKCAACFMCVMSCPFGVLRPTANHQAVVKCDFCDGDPSCVKECPKHAITVLEVAP